MRQSCGSRQPCSSNCDINAAPGKHAQAAVSGVISLRHQATMCVSNCERPRVISAAVGVFDGYNHVTWYMLHGQLLSQLPMRLATRTDCNIAARTKVAEWVASTAVGRGQPATPPYAPTACLPSPCRLPAAPRSLPPREHGMRTVRRCGTSCATTADVTALRNLQWEPPPVSVRRAKMVIRALHSAYS